MSDPLLPNKTALIVNDGIPQPPSVNEEMIQRLKTHKRRELSLEEIIDGIKKGDRSILSRGITLVESNLPRHQEMARTIVDQCISHSGKSIRIGITGVPGVGKSSFIESFGTYITSHGHKLAVLAIDPSSERSKGSILGDKTRMVELSANANAFIRPSPSAGALGGVARKTRETILLCEAAGFDVILVETVGVGQSETAVHSMVDYFLLLALAGAGDELQGIKRGIMEMADTIVITKADGSNVDKAFRAKAEITAALHFMPCPPSGWRPGVLTCSAHHNIGIDELWKTVLEFKKFVTDSGYFSKNRNEQSRYWMHQTIHEELNFRFYNNKDLHISSMEKDVVNGKISSFEAARQLLNKYFEQKK
jgi:LAO/AO transport system kinase